MVEEREVAEEQMEILYQAGCCPIGDGAMPFPRRIFEPPRTTSLEE